MHRAGLAVVDEEVREVVAAGRLGVGELAASRDPHLDLREPQVLRVGVGHAAHPRNV